MRGGIDWCEATRGPGKEVAQLFAQFFGGPNPKLYETMIEERHVLTYIHQSFHGGLRVNGECGCGCGEQLGDEAGEDYRKYVRHAGGIRIRPSA